MFSIDSKGSNPSYNVEPRLPVVEFGDYDASIASPPLLAGVDILLLLMVLEPNSTTSRQWAALQT